MDNRNKKVTMQDVARKAGVSYQTVSRVLNNSCNVSEATKEKIENAIAELKYVPNLLAQQLAKKERNVLGVISTALLSQASVDVAALIRKYALENGHQIAIELISSNDYESVQQSINLLKSQLVSKIVVNVPLDSKIAVEITKANPDCQILFVDVDPYCPVFNVTFNPADGTLFSVSHLRDLGHRKVALLAGPLGESSSDSRLKCWREGLKINNIEEVCIERGDWTAQSGYLATVKMLRDHQDFTAILVANDQMALGAISALNQNHKSVPEDISVVGYDDYVDSAYYQPPLTSVHLDRDLQCRLAVERLIDPDEPKVSSVLPTTLIIRKSTSSVGRKNHDKKNLVKALREVANLL
ncbi:MAG: LacI family DNA-binding transcriptional regulator, partial [Succinivibrio sp.]